MDGVASLANSPCEFESKSLPEIWVFCGKKSQLIRRHSVGGHRGGEQNAMAADGKIDIGCGTLEYTINWPKAGFSLWLPSPFDHSRLGYPQSSHRHWYTTTYIKTQNYIPMRVLLLTI